LPPCWLSVWAPLLPRPVLPRKSGSFYQVKVETSGTDGDMTAKITVTGTKGYHCNMEYPWKFVGIEAEGVTFAKAKLKKADAASFTPEKVVFQVSYKAASAVKKVDGYLKLSLCDDKQCQMEKVNLSWPAK